MDHPERIEVLTTKIFDDWLAALRDRRAQSMIANRIDRLKDGNPGNARAVGFGIVEMKIDFGPGYRVYYTQRGKELVILLCAGDKATQSRDIERARKIASTLALEEGS